jgi:hypothetical protein
MKATYLDQIENKIAAHRQTIEALQYEISKLEGAAEVIAQLRGNDGVQTLMLKAEPAARRSEPITIRKISDGRGARAAGGITGPEIRKRTKAALEANKGGMLLKQIGPAIGLPDDKKTANRIWYQLNQMHLAGDIEKDGHTYILKRFQDQGGHGADG